VDFGRQSDALFLMALQAIMEDIAYVVNVHLIPKFVDWNFGSSKYPKFTWGAFTDEQKEAINETFNKLSTAGQTMTVSEDFMFELEKIMAEDLGLSVDYEKVAKEKEEAKALAKQQQEAFMQQPQAAGMFGAEEEAPPEEEAPAEVEVAGQYYKFSAIPVSETLALDEE